MTNSNLNPKLHKTSHLYFHKYRYSANGVLQEVNVARGLETYSIKPRLDVKRSYFNNQRDLPRGIQRITEQTEENLVDFLEFITAIEDVEYRIVLNKHTFHCYSNDLGFLTNLLSQSGVTTPYINEANVVCDEDCLYRKNSKYAYRTYLHAHLSSDSKKALMKSFVATYDVRPCESFKKWLSFSTKYCYDHFFFDYNDPGILLIFELMAPGAIKKTYKLTGDNNE